MRRSLARFGVCALAVSLALAPAPSEAIAPVLLLMIKQIAQQAAKSMIKDALLSGLSGMGCKGMALASAIEALDPGGGGMLGMLGGMPKMAGGMAALSAGAGMAKMPVPAGLAGMPAGLPKMPAGVGMATGGMPGMPAGLGVATGGLPNMPGGLGLPMGAMLPGGGVPADVAAKLGTLMPGAGQLPAGLAMNADQMAMMAGMQEAMSHPLSPIETVAAIDELADLGFLPKPIQTELKECMVFVPAAIPALGMGMGMLKPIIPKLRQAREELRALSPAEQDEVADALVQELKSLPGNERAALVEYLDSGFFPARISERAKAGAQAR